MSPELLIFVELFLVFGGVLAFAAWQLKELSDLKRAREARARETAKDAEPGGG
jgi:hypothetical protein